jgi:transposase-like protein
VSEPKVSSLEWCTPQELARRWGVSENTVKRKLYERADPAEPVPAGKLPAIRIGSLLRVNVKAVEAFEAAGKPPPVPVAELRKGVRRVRRGLAMMAREVPNHLGL